MTELKPCPFCGATQKIKTKKLGSDTVFAIDQVHYNDCFLCGFKEPENEGYVSSNAAIDAWNRRFEEHDRGECEIKFVYYDLYPCDSVYRCMKCGTENPWVFNYCPGCGAKVTSGKSYCIECDPRPDPDVAELLEVADEIDKYDVSGCVDWQNRIRKALGVEK